MTREVNRLSLPTKQRYLGIDPGLNRTGYALLERSARGPVLREGGVIRSSRDLSLAQRVHEIAAGVREVIEEFQPTVMVVEQVFSTVKHPKSALMMAHARGAMLAAAVELEVDVVHYTPTQVKKLLTGSGRASKEQMQHAIKTELHLDQLPEPHDVADAFAIALCHYYSVEPPLLRDQIRTL